MYEDKSQNIVKTIADFLGITSHIYTECRVVQSCVSDVFERKMFIIPLFDFFCQ